MKSKLFRLGAAVVMLCVFRPVFSQTSGTSASEIQLALRKLNTVGTVMYVAAHPDDENTRLLSYLANERLFRTVYISLTRGDGGQNLIGDQQGEELGLIRTQELIAARKIDGAEQYFTSAVDFGYSKSPEETFSKWSREKVLADLVYAIRKFRPDVIINRFPTTGEGGHGHHTASAMLAVEAFKAAADPDRFPEQLKVLKPWQARRIFHNSFFPRGQAMPDLTGQIKLDVGGYNKLLGRSYGEIAADSRSMHKSQGFGVARTRGTQIEYFRKLDGDTLVPEILAGINPFWSRLENSENIQRLINEAIDYFNPANPEYTVPTLVKIYQALDELKDQTWKDRKKADVMDLIKACMGLYLEADAKKAEAAPGGSVTVELIANSRAFNGALLDKIMIGAMDTVSNARLKTNESFSWTAQVTIPKEQLPSEPYWLTGPAVSNLYPGTRELSGRPENDPALTATFFLTVESTRLSFEIPVTHKFTDPVKGEVYRPFAVLPAFSVIPSDPVLIFPSGESRKLHVIVSAQSDSATGTIKPSVPAGWRCVPATIPFEIKNSTREFTGTFEIFPPESKSDGTSVTDTAIIVVESAGKEYRSGVRRIQYDHIPEQFHLRESIVKLVRVDMKTVARNIGYLEGAGDDVAECLSRAGFHVEMLTDEMISNGNLSAFDAIVTGVRAYNTNERIGSYQEKLMQYVRNGGTLVVQYNTSNFLGTVKSEVGPYPFKISRDRVTDENAPVSFINKNHPALNFPNAIKQRDFNGWVQERGLYFATDTDTAYKKILAMNDSGEAPGEGSLIIASYGNGHFVYTGLSFFRQLPAGVPGAYRLLSNLINLGQNEKQR